MKVSVKVLAWGVGAPLMALGVGSPTASAAPCSANCGVGGFPGIQQDGQDVVAPGTGAVRSGYKAKGGLIVGPYGGTLSGTSGATSAPYDLTTGGSGHWDLKNPADPGTRSGNFTTIPTFKGRCTGALVADCA
jgi:hypothetical protein